MRSFSKIYFLIVITLISNGQKLLGQQDSLLYLNVDDYLTIVKQNHPVVRQTELILQQGSTAILKARGGFDPKLVSGVSQKYFDNKRYYNLWDAGLKVPTMLGVELQAGYESNSGQFLNPENNVPNSGLWYAGVSIPLGQGLVIDARRAAFRKAKLYQESTAFEQQMIINDLIYEAGRAYWNWFMHYHVLNVYLEAVRVADERFNGLRRSALIGERAAIDTLEAGIQLQNREISLNQANIEYQKAKAILVSHLWVDGIVPLELQENTIPISLEEVSIEESEMSDFGNLQELITNHPKLRLYQYKIGALEVDQKLKRDKLKPKVNLKLNAISAPVNGENVFRSYNSEDYTMGVDFSFPIFLRKERGDTRLAKLKVSDAQYEFRQNQAGLLAKATGALTEWTLSKDQVDIYGQIVSDYQRLFQGEQRLFQAGESSLFLVNSRESGYINARVKSIEIRAKNLKAKLAAEYAFGILN